MITRLLAVGIIGLLSCSVFASDDTGDVSSTVSDVDQYTVQNRRKERRDDRQDDRDDKQDCRQEEGRVGDDKRECKQENREEGDEGEDEAPKADA